MQELRRIFLRSCLPNIMLFFFSISGLNSHGFSLICSTWRHLKKIFKHTELFKKMRLISCLIYHKFGYGCKDFQIVKKILNEIFCGGLHLHCLTLSLQTLIVMLSMLIRSCSTVFPMNRAPGLWDLWQDLFTVLS